MPIISKKKPTFKSIKISIEQDVLEEVEQYCTFAQLESIDDFFNESSKFVLSKDKEWKKHKKSIKN